MPSGRPTVCVIEDDAGIREALRTLLEDDGYQVIEAADGVAGLTLLRSHAQPLVVLLDHKLPVLDGCDLLDLVAQDASLRDHHAFIMVTASPQRVEQECGETIDDLDGTILGKPFDIDHVLDAVEVAAQRLIES